MEVSNTVFFTGYGQECNQAVSDGCWNVHRFFNGFMKLVFVMVIQQDRLISHRCG